MLKHYVEALDPLARAFGQHRSTGPPRGTARELLRCDTPRHNHLIGIDYAAARAVYYHCRDRYTIAVAFDEDGLYDGGPRLATFRLDYEDDSEEWHIHHGAEHILTLPVNPQKGLSDDLPVSLADVSLTDQLRTTNWVEITLGGDPGSPMFEREMMILADLEDGSPLNARAVASAMAHPDRVRSTPGSITRIRTACSYRSTPTPRPCPRSASDNESEIYRCTECGQEVCAGIAENADWLAELAASDLPCAWIAEELLNGQ